MENSFFLLLQVPIWLTLSGPVILDFAILFIMDLGGTDFGFLKYPIKILLILLMISSCFKILIRDDNLFLPILSLIIFEDVQHHRKQ